MLVGAELSHQGELQGGRMWAATGTSFLYRYIAKNTLLQIQSTLN
jgi:hypothetical protein